MDKNRFYKFAKIYSNLLVINERGCYNANCESAFPAGMRQVVLFILQGGTPLRRCVPVCLGVYPERFLTRDHKNLYIGGTDMKKTRTRIGSILLALALVLTLLPATALAAEIPVEGGELEAGTYTLTEDTKLGQKLVVPANADVTIDLAGHTLDFSACGANCIGVLGTLTIKDSSEEETGKILGN